MAQDNLTKRIQTVLSSISNNPNVDKEVVDLLQDIQENDFYKSVFKKHASLFNHLQEAIAVYEPIENGRNFKFVNFNSAAEKIENLKREEVIGRTLTDVFPAAKEFGFLKVLKKVWKTGIPQIHPVTFYEDDRIFGWRENYVFKLPSGEIVASYRDVTEQKKADAEIMSSESNLKSLINNRDESIWSIDTEYNYVIINDYFRKQYLKNFNIKLEAGINALDLLSKDMYEFWKEKYDRALGGEKFSFEFESTYRKKTHCYSVSLNPIVLDKLVTGVSCLSVDITDQRQTLFALKESEEKYKLITDTSVDAIFRMDQRGKLLYFSKSIKNIIGYKPDELVGKSFKQFIDKQDIVGAISKLKSAFNNKNITNFRTKAIHKNGKIVYLEINGTYIEKDGQLIGQGSIRDISTKVIAENMLRLSEENYKGIFNTAADAIYILNKKFEFIIVNKGAKIMYGYEPHEFIGKTPAFVSAPDKNDFEKVIKYLQTAYNGKKQKFEFWGLRKNGDIFPKEVRVYPGKYNGEKVVLAIGRDITERKEANEKIKQSELNFKNLIDFAPDAFFQGDSEGNFIMCNRAAIKLTGYGRKELLQMNVAQLFSSNVLTSKPLRYDLLKKGKEIRNERTIIRKDKSEVLVEMTSKRMFDETYQTFMRDVTEKRKSENALIESEQKYREIVQNLKHSYYEADKRGIITFVNPEFKIVSDYNEKELLGRLSFSLIAEEHKSSIVKQYQKALKEKTPYINSEFKVNLNNNKTIWVEQLTTFYFDDEGNFVNATNVVKDITEKKLAQLALEESENNFRLLFENSPLGTYIANTDGSIIDVNNTVLNILGSPSAEATKQINVLKFPPLVKNGYAKIFSECVANNEIKTLEIPYKSNWGKEIYLSSYIIPLANKDGKTERVYTIMEDITDRKKNENALKESEGLFRNLTTSTSTAIFIYQNDNFVFVNKATEKLTGYQAKELLTMKFWDPVHPEYRELTKNRGMARQKGEKVPSRYQVKLLKKNGETVWIDYTAGNISYNGQHAAIGSAIDITDLKNTEEQLRVREERYKIISDSTSDYLFSSQILPDGSVKMEWVGGSFEKITGYSFEEYRKIGGWPATLYREDVNIDFAALEELKNNRSIEIEVRVYNKKGQIIWVRCSASPVWSDDEERVTTIVGAVKDITEEKEAELKVYESEERYRLISGLTSDYLFTTVIDKNGKSILKWVGGSFKKITGYTFEEYKKIGGWLATLHPDDRQADKDAFEKLLKNKKVKLQVRTFHKDGNVVWVETVGSPLWDEKANKLVGVNGAVRDITKEKEASMALKENEKKYRLISNLTSDYIYEARYNEDGFLHTTWVAGSFKKITGYTLEEYQYNGDWAGHVHKDDIQKDLALLDQLKHNKKGNAQIRVYNKNGRVVWLDVNCSPIWDNENDKLAGIIGANKDITLEKQTQIIQEIQYNIANAIVNEQSTKVLFNILRRELDKILDTTNFYVAFYNDKTGMLKSDIDNDEKDYITSWPAKNSVSGYLIERAKKTLLYKEDILTLEKEGKINLIGTVPEVWLGVPLRERGNVIGVMVIQNYKNKNVFDQKSIELFEVIGNQISLFLERNKANQDSLRLSRAIMQSPVSVVITNPDGEIEYVNPKFEKISGYTFEEAFGNNPRILKSGEHSDLFYKTLWETISEGSDWKGEILNKKKDGTLYWENVVISPIVGEDGKVTHYVAIKEDITERKQMIEDLIKAKEEAIASEKIKTEFLAQMSHEIRSPLNVVMSFIGLIKEDLSGNLSEDLEYSFQSIESASNRIIRTIELILNMTDLQLGTYNTSVGKVNVATMLNEVQGEYIQSANNKNLKINLELNLKNNIITSDDYALRQIVSNLVDNAIKYTNEGEVNILAKHEKKGILIIEVKDTGIGMNEEFLPSLFNSFTQEEHGYSRKFDGNGLGMALVKKYCDIISTNITVTSKKGVGTKFKLEVKNLEVP